jgi:hypothetical protein
MLKLAALLKTPTGPMFMPLAISRAAYGLFFAASGFNKLFVAQNSAAMLETRSRPRWRCSSRPASSCSDCCWRWDLRLG